MILFYADTRHASATSDDPVTTGSVGIPVTVTLTPDYTGLNATLVFENGTTYADVPLLGQNVTVPSDVCLKTGKLRMGVYASDQSGEVVIPTIWADVSPVVVGVRPSGIDPAPPAPSWADLVMEAARTAREDAEAARADADSARADADLAREDAEAAKSDADRALSVSNDVEMLEDVSASLTPFFSRNPPYGGAYYDDYWNSYSSYYLTNLDGGWVHVHDDRSNEQGSGLWSYELASVKSIGHLRPGRQYTFMIEVRNFSWVSGDVANAPRLSVSTGRDGSGYNSQVYAETDLNFVQITGDGEYVIQTTGSLNQNATNLISIGASAYSGTSFEYDMRVSLYSGAHAGNYFANPTGIDDRLSSVSTVADEAHAMNLTPMFSAYDDNSYWNSISAKYGDEPHPRNGWIGLHVTDDDELRYVLIADLGVLDWIVPSAPYTLLIEVVGLDESSAEATLIINMSASQLYQRSTGYADVTTTITDGSYRFFMSARDNAHSSFFTCATSFSIFVPIGVEATFAVRASLYDGDYTGEYKPCLSWINGEVEGLSEISEEISEIKEDISSIGGFKNLTPFFSHNNVGSGALITDQYWETCDAWKPDEGSSAAGWWVIEWNDYGGDYREWKYTCPRNQDFVEEGKTYTLLIEVSGIENDGDVTPAIRIGSVYSQLIPTNADDNGEVIIEIDGEGQYRTTLTTRRPDDPEEIYRLVELVFLVPSSQNGLMMVRASLYEGDYQGNYVPYWDYQFVDDQLYNACNATNTLSQTVNTVSGVASKALSLTAHNVVPMLSALGDDSRWYSTESLPYVTYLGDGWAHVGIGEDGVGAPDLRLIPATSDVINIEKSYTLLVEVRNVRYAGPGELKVKVPKKSSTPKQQLFYYDYESSTYKTFYKSDNYRKLLLPGLGANRFNDLQCDCLMVVEFVFAGDSRFEFDLRLSVYDDKSYQGDYVPCEWWLASEVERLSGEVATLGDTVGELSEAIEGIDATVAAAVAEATASEDVSNNVVINPDLPVFAGGAQARRIGGVVFLSATIQLSERITISSNNTLVFTLTGKALPETFTYLATSIPGVQVVVGMGKMTIRATGADVSVGVSDDFIVSGSYLAQ